MRNSLVVSMLAAMLLWPQPCNSAERLDPDQLPSIKELPDPFRFNDGSRVKSPQDWAKRRAELRELVQIYQYGHLPPVAPVLATPAPDYQPPEPKPRPTAPSAAPPAPAPSLPAGTTQEKLLLTVTPPGSARSVAFHLLLAIPPGDGPFPAIVRGDLCWGPARPEIVAEVVGRGYILAEFDRTEIVPDKAGPRDSGAYLVWPEGNFSATAAWAWGYHRVIDHLLTRRQTDALKIVVTGHSRGGKTALLAGAMDDRIALTNPNNSGCGGAGCYRHQAPKSEDIGAILKNFPHWFQADFRQFIGKVDRLPIDQHSVKAVIAPRALLSTEALGDLWANPEGTQVTHLAAKEVFSFLGITDRIGIHFRPGGHEHNLYDWQTLLEFADRLFSGRPATREFDQPAFPEAPRIWSWSAPGATIR
jgi:hypothetical protein